MTVANLPGTTTPKFTMEVDSAQPWSTLPELHSTRAATNELRFDVHTAGETQTLVLNHKDTRLGRVSAASLKDLSERVVFPTDFVLGLPIALQAQVLNDRLAKSKELPYTLIGEVAPTTGEQATDTEPLQLITHASPGTRGIVNPSYMAQTAWNIMESVYGDGIEVKDFHWNTGAMELRIKSDFVADVSRKRALNDIISLGVQLIYHPGIDIEVSLYIERLLCLNGMTGFGTAFNWKARTLAGDTNQIDFVKIGIAEAISNFDTIAGHLGDMSEQMVPGDPRQALLQRARAMGITRQNIPALQAAWEVEPDGSEFGMLNAVTRYATHNTDISRSLSRRLQATAGQWCAEFDVVNCRMPRTLAVRAGAQIIEEEA